VADFKYERWGVQRSSKLPLLNFLLDGLRARGCTILHASDPAYAPFFVTFDTPLGERQGVLIYAFLANSRLTRNRPFDEHRFQVKYGSDATASLHIEQDPSRLITTLFVGIDPERDILIGADPTLHCGTKMFISLEFKRSHAEAIVQDGWHAWERESFRSTGEPVEVLVGVTKENVLDFIRFERLALGLDSGHRQLLAEQLFNESVSARTESHALIKELALSERQVLDLIQSTSRLKMAVRGWVAEHHLEDYLRSIPGISDCRRLEGDGLPDIELRFKNGPPVLIECKNVLRDRASDGAPRVDFQRTRASKANPCSRYYRPTDFHIVAACLHAVTENWEYRFIPTTSLPSHAKCAGRIQSNLRVDQKWFTSPIDALSSLLPNS